MNCRFFVSSDGSSGWYRPVVAVSAQEVLRGTVRTILVAAFAVPVE
jgi:hypothetical protein